MTQTPSDLHSAWARLFFRSLASAGVTEVVCCPGSRSTPLALAAEGDHGLRVISVVDERAAAFVGLGQGRTSGKPSVVIATSGTAGAHFFPAVIEASEARVPMILVTADRPWEAQDAGASQTIDQHKLFGGHVRKALELGLPDAAALNAIPRIAAQAVLAASHPDPGPVHVNAQFRKPLEPIVGAGREDWTDRLELLMSRGAPTVHLPSRLANRNAIAGLTARAARSERCVIVIGPRRQGAQGEGTVALQRAAFGAARACGAIVCAEATSGVPYGGAQSEATVACFGGLLAAGAFKAAPPDLIIEVSGPPVAGAYEAFLSSRHHAYRVLLSDHPFPDPSGTADELILGDAASVLEAIAVGVAPRGKPSGWAATMVALGRKADEHAAMLAREWSEAAVARTVIDMLPEHTVFMVGNSSPIRDVDAFGGSTDRGVVVQHQRGAAGIDGLIAGALGARTVTAKEVPVLLLLGDVSALHDVGSFALLGGVTAPLVVVVIDNAGGRIFEELPIGRAPAHREAFEKLFVTSPCSFLEGVASGFGVMHARVADIASFRSALGEALHSARATVIQCAVRPSDGRERRAAWLKELRELVVGAFPQ